MDTKPHRKKLTGFVPQNLTPFHVLTEPQTRTLCGSLSKDTWNKLRARGDIPPKTQLSPGRIGYMVKDIQAWLEKRRSPIAA
jgi:predicted DNA-binding transcriptional regulator AlpA